MKKLISVLCVMLISILSFAGCITKGNDDNEVAENQDVISYGTTGSNETVLPYSSYNRKTYVKPYWTGNIVYNENVMFVGADDKVPLMYTAEEILSVRSYDLNTVYQEGVDYNYDKLTNRLTLTSGTRIKHFPFEWYYPTDAVVAQYGLQNGVANAQGLAYFDTNNPEVNRKRIIYSETLFNAEGYQLAITYRHAGDNYIKTPAIDSTNFASQLNAIKNKSKIKILFYGDSVTVGCNAGSIMNFAPYMANWATMTYETLISHYNISSKAEYNNLAVGGWNSLDGSTATVSGESSTRFQQVLAYNPDIMFLGFGLNDINFDPATHITNLDTILTAVLNQNPNCIVILVGSYLPHPEVVWVNQQQLKFPAQYPSLAASLERRYGHHVFFANVMPEHADILTRKRYYDGTSNNVNHPNDFICRLYAQTILYTLCGDYTADLY